MNPPPYVDFPTLESPRLSLRQIRESDVKSVMDISFYNAQPATTVEEAWQMQQRIDDDYEQGNSVHWGIVQKEDGHIAGTCGYYRGFANETGEVGFILKPHYRGHGLMTMALKMAIDFGFDTIELQRIAAFTTRPNYHTTNLLERLGFTLLAFQKETDILEYGLLKSERHSDIKSPF